MIVRAPALALNRVIFRCDSYALFQAFAIVLHILYATRVFFYHFFTFSFFKSLDRFLNAILEENPMKIGLKPRIPKYQGSCAQISK